MITADLIAEDDLKLELSQLWMLPLILFQIICSLYANHVARLKQMRISSLPKDWYDHHDRLMAAEWRIRAVIAEGVRRLLAGQPLDYASLTYPNLPPDQFWSPPSSGWQTHLRMEALARFMADPETHIRNHAQRIAMIEAKKRFGLTVEPDTFLVFTRAPLQTARVLTPTSAERIRAPP